MVGDWIFDNAHDGWLELHPVKSLMRMPCPQDRSVPGIDIEAPQQRALQAGHRGQLPAPAR